MLIYIHSLENGGAERVVANLANYWAARGWELTIVTVAPVSSDFYLLHPRVARIGMDLGASAPGVLQGALRTARRVGALRRCLRSVQPDVALSAMHTANVVLAIASRGVPVLRCFGSEHNFPPKAPMGIIWETLRRHAYARLDAVTALTTECALWLATHSRARSVPVIPNPVSWPLADQEPRIDPLSCCRPGRRIVLAAGRLSTEKNFGMLVELFSRLAHLHPGWDLVILGDGPLRAELQAQAAGAGLAGRVFLPGRVGNMASWYAHSHVFAMTSLFEGFPNTLVEAMACGLPVASVDCDTGPRDIVRHGVDGFLVAQGNIKALAAALDLLMGHEALRLRFGRRAQEARERFAIDKVAARWELLFGLAALPGADDEIVCERSTPSVVREKSADCSPETLV